MLSDLGSVSPRVRMVVVPETNADVVRDRIRQILRDDRVWIVVT